VTEGVTKCKDREKCKRLETQEKINDKQEVDNRQWARRQGIDEAKK
jgi:hypothetical protein